nr:hypothetical protein [Sicyoidochytrium minutum DNA virus]
MYSGSNKYSDHQSGDFY